MQSARFFLKRSQSGKSRRSGSVPTFSPGSTERSERAYDSHEPVQGGLSRFNSRNGPESVRPSPEHSAKRSERRRDSEPSSEKVPIFAPTQAGRKRAGNGLVAETRVATYRAEEKSILIPKQHTADPSARVINGRLYVIASHDIQTRKNTGPGWKEGTRWACFSQPHQSC